MTYRKMLLFTLFAAFVIHVQALMAGEKVTLRDDGILLVNGKPFYPIGTYRDPSDAVLVFDGVCEAGFNTTHSYYFETPVPSQNAGKVFDEPLTVTAQRYLRAAHKNGLKVFLGIPRDMIRKNDLEGIRKYVLALKDELGLLVWYLTDDWGAAPAVLRRIKQTVTEADPNHPTFIVPPGNQTGLQGCCDIIGIMSYGASGIQARNEMNGARRKMGQQNFPVWVIVGAHQDRHSLTPKKVRAQMFLSAISGAQGILFYWWPNNHKNVGNIRDKPPGRWEGICSMVKDLKRVSPVLTGGVESFISPKVSLEPVGGVFTLVRVYQGNLYIFVVNSSNREVAARLELPDGITVASVTDALLPQQKLELKEGTIRLQLDPYGVSVLRFSK